MQGGKDSESEEDSEFCDTNKTVDHPTTARPLRRSTRLHAYEARKAIAESYADISEDEVSSPDFAEEQESCRIASPNITLAEKPSATISYPEEFEQSLNAHVMRSELAKGATDQLTTAGQIPGRPPQFSTDSDVTMEYPRFDYTSSRSSYPVAPDNLYQAPAFLSHTLPGSVEFPNHVTTFHSKYYSLWERKYDEASNLR